MSCLYSMELLTQNVQNRCFLMAKNSDEVVIKTTKNEVGWDWGGLSRIGNDGTISIALLYTQLLHVTLRRDSLLPQVYASVKYTLLKEIHFLGFQRESRHVRVCAMQVQNKLPCYEDRSKSLPQSASWL